MSTTPVDAIVRLIGAGGAAANAKAAVEAEQHLRAEVDSQLAAVLRRTAVDGGRRARHTA